MKSFFTETILKRGKTYFEQNRVFSVNQYDNQTYTGIILGNEAYHTKITLDEHYDVMSATCDCPYAKEGNHCNMKRHFILRLKIDFLKMNNNILISMLY